MLNSVPGTEHYNFLLKYKQKTVEPATTVKSQGHSLILIEKQAKSEQLQSCWTPIFTGLVESVLFFYKRIDMLHLIFSQKSWRRLTHELLTKLK